MADVVYLQPYGGTTEIVKFILKTIPGLMWRPSERQLDCYFKVMWNCL